MFSILFNIFLWILAAWLLYPLVLIQFDLGDVQTSFFRSISGVALLIIMFGKNMVDIIFLKMEQKELHLRRVAAMNVALTYIFIIVSVITFAISVILMLATQQQSSSPTQQQPY